jgi:hypothetical protein
MTWKNWNAIIALHLICTEGLSSTPESLDRPLPAVRRGEGVPKLPALGSILRQTKLGETWKLKCLNGATIGFMAKAFFGQYQSISTERSHC